MFGFLITSPCPVLGLCPGPEPGPSSDPSTSSRPNRSLVPGPAPDIILVLALVQVTVPVKISGTATRWVRDRQGLAYYPNNVLTR